MVCEIVKLEMCDKVVSKQKVESIEWDTQTILK